MFIGQGMRRGFRYAALMRRSGLALLGVCALLAGCEDGEPRPPQSPAGAAPSATPLHAAGPCVVRAAQLHDRPPLRLAVRERGPVTVEIYADLRDVTLRMAKTTRIDAVAGPVLLSGWVDPASLSLYTTRPVVAGPLFVLTGYRDLSRDVRAWPTQANETARVSVDAPAGISARPALAEVPCAALSFEPTDLDPLTALGKTASRSAVIPSGRRVTLHESDVGPPLGDLTLAGPAQPVTVLAEKSARAHIAFPRGAVLVHAWVKREELLDAPPEPRSMVTIATSADRFEAPAVTETRICPHDVSITVVEPGGRVPMPLGTLPAGAKLGIVMWERDQTRVFVQNAGIFPVAGATLLVSTKHLDDCRAP